MDEEGEAHASRIRCRFKRARRDCMGRSFWEHWRTETCAFLVAMCSTVLILFLEPALWSDTWPAGIFDFRIPNSLAASLLLVLPFNGWLLDRFLSSKTANETACPQWLLMLRGLFASVPLAGLYAISLWKLALAWTASRRVTRSLRLDLSRRCDRLAVGLHPRALYRSGFFFVWLASNFLPLLVWALWLGQTGALGSARRPVIAGVCILLHLVAAFSIGLHVWTELQSPEIRGWRRALLALAPASWLLAIPGMVLGFSAFLLADPPRKSLTWLTYASRTAAMRDRGWRELQGSLRRSWERKSWFKQWRRPAGLLPSQGRGHADLQVIALQRLKTLLLTLESGALLAVLPAGFTPVALPRTLWVAASLAALGLGIQTVGLAARLLRAPWSLALHRHPYGRYLLLSQSAFLSGLGAADRIVHVLFLDAAQDFPQRIGLRDHLMRGEGLDLDVSCAAALAAAWQRSCFFPSPSPDPI